jgi:hypothetical protein
MLRSFETSASSCRVRRAGCGPFGGLGALFHRSSKRSDRDDGSANGLGRRPQPTSADSCPRCSRAQAWRIRLVTGSDSPAELTATKWLVRCGRCLARRDGRQMTGRERFLRQRRVGPRGGLREVRQLPSDISRSILRSARRVSRRSRVNFCRGARSAGRTSATAAKSAARQTGTAARVMAAILATLSVIDSGRRSDQGFQEGAPGSWKSAVRRHRLGNALRHRRRRASSPRRKISVAGKRSLIPTAATLGKPV